MATAGDCGPQNEVQEIIIRTAAGRRLRLAIQRNLFGFETMALIVERRKVSSFNSAGYYYGRSAELLHERILGEVVQWLKSMNDSILEVDNPGNTLFVPIDHQKALAERSSPPYAVKLNGNAA